MLRVVVTRLEGRVSPAVLALVKAQVVQAGGFGAVIRAVDGFGGFAKQYEQIEKVCAQAPALRVAEERHLRRLP